MKQLRKCLITDLFIIVAIVTAAGDQQHRPFATPAAAYAPLFGERATAAKSTLLPEDS
jgi:hypothetical protein